MLVRKLPFFIILFLFSQHIFAGWQDEINDYRQRLDTTQSDTTKIKIMIAIGDRFLPNIPDISGEYFFRANALASEIKDSSFMALSLLNICEYHMMNSEYSLALKTAFDALGLSGKNKKLLSLSHERIAEAYSFLEIFDKSVYHNRISLKLEIERKDTLRIASTFHLIGIYFLELDQYDSALYYLYKARDYNVLMNGQPDPFDLSHIGHTYTYMGLYDSALYYHYQAYLNDSISGNSYDLAVDEYYIAFTDFSNSNFDNALKYINKSIEHSEKLGLYETMLYCYELLYKIHEKQGNYKKAFRYSVLKNDYADTLREKNKQTYVKNLEAQHKFEEQQKILEASEAKNRLLERQSQLLVILTVVSLLLLGSMFVIFVLISKRHQTNRILLKEVENANLAKEKLISVISHDVRSLIGTIRNGLKYTLEDSLDFGSVKKMLGSFYLVVDSTYDLLDNLLTWAQDSKENLEPAFKYVNLKQVCEPALKHTAPIAARKDITISNTLCDIEIEADKNMLTTIIRNLVSNAIKFSPIKTTVSLFCKVSGQNVEIHVIDEGVGIPEELLSDIFNNPASYLHTKGTMGERGSGLGLSICKSFIDKHNGRFWAESKLGKGSTFFVLLPLKQKK